MATNDIWNIRSTDEISDSETIETASSLSMEDELSLLAGTYQTFDGCRPTKSKHSAPASELQVAMEFRPGDDSLELGRGQLITFKTYQALYKRQIAPMDLDGPSDVVLPKKEPLTSKRGAYRVYTAAQVEELIDMVANKGYTAAGAGRVVGIKERTAQGYMALFWKDEQQRVPIPGVKHKNGGNRKLFQEHTDFLVAFFDDDPTHTLAEAKFALEEQFTPMTISASGLRNHLRSHCMLTLKKVQIISDARNSPRTRQLRREKILEWNALPDFNFLSSCVFLDEAGFNLHLRRGFGWATRGKTPKVKVPASKGPNITILGAICELGIINLTLRKPTTTMTSDKNGKKMRAKAGTRTEDFLAFVDDVLSCLENDGISGRYIIMDNCRIHTGDSVKAVIKNRGFKPMFLPPYSPFLNPIEECWAKIKAGVRRSPLDDQDSLAPRIREAALTVTPSDCQGWIRHSLTFYDRCLSMEEML